MEATAKDKGFLAIFADNFSVLRIRNIRWYMLGQSINLVGDWMQQTAQAWVVWQLTHTATSLGVVAFLSQIPYFLFGPWIGSFSDRIDKRKILLVTQFLAMVMAFVLALLIQTERLALWHVYLLAFLLGVVTAFNTTAEQAFIGEIAGTGNIKKAIALNNSINQLSRFIGPAIAGWLINSVGLSLSFWINGLSVIVSILCIWKIPSSPELKIKEGSGLELFLEGIRFLFRNRLLKLILLLASIQAFFGMSIVQLLPAVSTLLLKGDAKTLGLLVGAAGAGAFTGTVFILPFVQRIPRSCLAIGGAVIWSGIWYCLFSFSRSLHISMLCQFLASMGATNVMTLSIGLGQELTPVDMRARIISAFLMIILGLQPLASYLVGKGADLLGVQTMMIINGALMITLSAILLAIPVLRRVKVRAELPAIGHPRIN